MRETTASRLNQIMREKNLKQRDILLMVKPYCEDYRVKLNSSDLSQYVNGKVEPGQTKLFVLARALDVNEAWLMGYDVNRERFDDDDAAANTMPVPSVRRIPRLGTIACGEPILAEQNIEGYDTVPDYIKCDFTLVCRGDSMVGARILDGDIVCIKQQPEAENGQIAAVQIDEENATLKRVRFDGEGGITLWPENPAYAPKHFTGADVKRVRILGIATHFISRVV